MNSMVGEEPKYPAFDGELDIERVDVALSAAQIAVFDALDETGVEIHDNRNVDADSIDEDTKQLILSFDEIPGPALFDVVPRSVLRQARDALGSPELDVTDAYMVAARSVPLLTREQEVGLKQIIERGELAAQIEERGVLLEDHTRLIREGVRARDHMMRANLRWVMKLASRFPLPPDMTRGDLVQEGNLGLSHAITKFDWRKGFKFSTYSAYWIRQSIGRAIDDKSGDIRIPVHRATSYRASRRAGVLSDEDQRIQAMKVQLRFEAQYGTSDDTAEFGDFLPIEGDAMSDRIEQLTSRTKIAELIEDLPDPRMKDVLIRRYGLLGDEPQTLEQVGQIYGVTRERIRQIEARALSVIRDKDAGLIESAESLLED